MANSYHMEALRKQRLLDRKNEALRRLESQGSDLTREAVMDGYLSKKTPKESMLITDGGQFDQQRYQLPMFRVNEEGLKNRYRNRQELAPHCDEAFVLLYPGNDNSDYICNVNQNNRRMNIMQNPESLLAKNLRKGFDFSQNRKHRLEINSVPNLPPPTILAIQRDHVYKIFHPYDFHTKNQGGNGQNCHKHINFSNVASDKIYPILHPKPVFKMPVPELPCRKQHFKV